MFNIPDSIMFKITKTILYVTGSTRAFCGKICMVLFTIAVVVDTYFDFSYFWAPITAIGTAWLWWMFNSLVDNIKEDSETKTISIYGHASVLLRTFYFWSSLLQFVLMRFNQTFFIILALAFYFVDSPPSKRTLPGDIRKLVKNLTPSFGKPVAIPVGARSHNGIRSLPN